MTASSGGRDVRLIDGHSPGRSFVVAQVLRDVPVEVLDAAETAWSDSRAGLAAAWEVAGHAPPEHSHWDWRNKVGAVRSGRLRLTALVTSAGLQGLLAVRRTPRPGQFGPDPVVYVDYLEVAPWNLKGPEQLPRLVGVGSTLLADAVRLSLELGLAGRVGLHSLPQAESFYARCRMTRLGCDADYYGLTYFEYTDDEAAAWLAALEDRP